MGLITFLAIYIYFALLFSFVYLGVGRLVGSPLSWGEWLVNSLFIPAYVSNFPKSIFLRILAGIHFTLVVTVGIGTVLNYFRGRIERLRKVTTLVSVRLSESEIRERYVILQQKVDATPRTNP